MDLFWRDINLPLFEVLFLSLIEWLYLIWCVILLNIIHIHTPNLDILVPEGPSCVFYTTRCQVYQGLTHNVIFPINLIWYHTDTYKKTHNTLRDQQTDISIQIYMTSPAMYSQQLHVLDQMNNLLILKIYFPQCLCFLKITHL